MSAFDLSQLLGVDRRVKELCIRLEEVGLIPRHRACSRHLDTPELVFVYVGVHETAMALSLLLISVTPAQAIPERERVLAAELAKDLNYEMWAVPGSAENWVAERLATVPALWDEAHCE